MFLRNVYTVSTQYLYNIMDLHRQSLWHITYRLPIVEEGVLDFIEVKVVEGFRILAENLWGWL